MTDARTAPALSRLGHLLGIAAWVVVAVLAAAVLLRFTAADRTSWLVLLATLTPMLYLPAWVVTAFAAATRRWRLLVAAAVLVGLHLWWVSPLFVGARGPISHAPASARVLALNLNADRSTGAAAQRLIAKEHPDVVVLSEASPVSMRGLDLTSFAVVVSDVEPGTNGWAVLSRWPLLDQRRVGIGDRELPRLVLQRPDGGRLIVWQVHPVAPVPGDVTRWRHQLVAIRAAISVDRANHDPVIVAGDFNATRDVPEFGAMLDDGWIDATDGHGLFATWRADGRLPPLLRLDHILISANVGVSSIRRAPRVGSDHLGLIATLDVR